MDIKYIPAHILRLYTWGLLQANLGWTEINGVIPIVPIDEERLLAQSGKAYIVYGYSENYDGAIREISRGSFSMRIVSPSFGQMNGIVNVLTRAFEMGDDSAENVNLWSTQFPNGTFVGVRFTTLDVTYVEGGTPSDMEGGPTEAVVNIGYRYVTQQKVKTYRPNGTWS